MNTELIWQTVTVSSTDTEKLGQLLGQLLSGGSVVELKADLGGGKTTFVRGLAAGLGASEDVTSPTFTLQQVYSSGKFELHHFDFYRLDDPGVVAAQLKESLENPKAVTVVEWGKTVANVLPKDRLIVELLPRPTSQDERQINLHYTAHNSALVEKLRNEWSQQ